MGREVITEQDVQNAKLRRAAAGSVASGTELIPVADKYGDRLIKQPSQEIQRTSRGEHTSFYT